MSGSSAWNAYSLAAFIALVAIGLIVSNNPKPKPPAERGDKFPPTLH